MLKPVKQEDNFGCAVACLAFFLKKSYQEIVKELGQQQAQKKGFFCREIGLSGSVLVKDGPCKGF